MKNRPLSVQIGIMFAGITLLFSIVLVIVIFFTVKTFFMQETYQLIEDAQHLRLQREQMLDSPLDRDQTQQTMRTVNHIVILENGRALGGRPLPNTIIAQLADQAQMQQANKQRYSRNIRDERIFYVIRKTVIRGRSVTLVSYMWDNYYNALVKTLFHKLLTVIALLLLFIWVPAWLWSRYLTKPLVQMEKHVRSIAEKNRNEKLETDRRDEIGKLARSIETMRKTIVRQEKAQQSLLQHISHELKTPIMVIRNYVEAIRDGIYPKADLAGSLDVIQQETSRLNKRIQDLLYLSKLDYYTEMKPNLRKMAMHSVIEDVVNRLRPRKREIDISLSLFPLTIQGDDSLWKVALENIMDNMLRYARTSIEISFQENSDDTVTIQFRNDGPAIDESTLKRLFNEFSTGKGGQFGLGLAIVHRIVRMHKARIWVENENNGVCFSLRVSPEKGNEPPFIIREWLVFLRILFFFFIHAVQHQLISVRSVIEATLHAGNRGRARTRLRLNMIIRIPLAKHPGDLEPLRQRLYFVNRAQVFKKHVTFIYIF